ncbi:MAG: hypothetical protein ACI9MR_000140 [Myxococcota bacterium]|jgi:hypothetical protein
MKTFATLCCLTVLSLPTAASAAPEAKDSKLVLETQTITFDVRDKERGKNVSVKINANIPKGWTVEVDAEDHRARAEGPIPPGGKKWSAPYHGVTFACGGACAGSLMIEQMKKSVKSNLDYARKSKRKIVKDEEIRPGVLGYAYEFPPGNFNYTVYLYEKGWPRMLKCAGKAAGAQWEQLYKACAGLTAEVIDR